MGNYGQSLIEEISKSKIKTKKTTKKLEKTKKNYEKALIFQKKQENPKISVYELSTQLGISKDDVNTYLEDWGKFVEEQALAKKPKEKKINKVKQKVKEIKEKSKKYKLDEVDKKLVKNILLKIVLYGIPINFSLYCIFRIPFTFYTWIGWGYAFWFIKKEAISFFRSLWFR